MQRRKLILTLLFLPAALLARGLAASTVAVEFDANHELWTSVLQKHVANGTVNYGALKQDRVALDRYVKGLERVQYAEFQTWPRAEKYAFWINAYNACTVQLIVDNYPLKSIKDIKKAGRDAWNAPLVGLAHLAPALKSERLTLNDIENRILRPTFKDPRIHAAVNCAAVSCPALAAEAFTAKALDKQLDRQTNAWLGDATRNQFDRAKGQVRLSKLFEWYADDFKLGGTGPGEWLTKHAPEQHREWLAAGKWKVTYLEYDWKLNDATR